MIILLSSWCIADLRLTTRFAQAQTREENDHEEDLSGCNCRCCAVGAALNAAAAGPAPTGIKNVVLVHGAFADGSGWDAVAKILEKDGYTVSVAQPPETSYADDQKYTKAA